MVRQLANQTQQTAKQAGLRGGKKRNENKKGRDKIIRFGEEKRKGH